MTSAHRPSRRHGSSSASDDAPFGCFSAIKFSIPPVSMWPAGHTGKNSQLASSSAVLVPVHVTRSRPRIGAGSGRYEMAEFVSNYGIWVVVAFIALESVGIPLPAEAALIAAAFFAARTQGINIWYLIAAGIFAAVLGEIVGFWLGRKFGPQLLSRYGSHLGFTEGRIRIGQWLFVRYG